jgi:DNA adenine methylase
MVRSGKQLIKYAGSKFGLIAKHLALMPPHIHYISVFGGTSPDILCKPHSALETYNDKSRNLYSIFLCLQDDNKYRRLLKLFSNTTEGRQQFKDCLALLRSDEPDPVKRAWAYLVVGVTCDYHKDPWLASNWRGSQWAARGKVAALPELLQKYRDRFRHVNLECLDWREIIRKYDSPDSLLYCDPPYPGGVLQSDANQYYEHTLTDEDHKDLLDMLTKLQGCVMLCGYNHPLYTRYLFYWRKKSFERRCNMSTKKTRPKRIEQLWLNYEEDGSKVASNKLLITQRYLEILGGRVEAERFMDLLETFGQIKAT